MRDAQTAKPHSFRTGDGWFAYNLAANLAQPQGYTNNQPPSGSQRAHRPVTPCR